MRPTKLKNAKTNNLKGVDLELASGQLIGVAGPSGAGKSSLAFATLYAEGQRRYVESFSAYARQFLERLPRPPVDELDPIPAAIAVDRQGTVRTSRSTVGTMTEIADYAKSLWAREAVFVCPTTGQALRDDQPEAVADELLTAHEGAKATITFREVVRDEENFLSVREALVKDGYRRLAVEDAVVDLDEVRPSDVLGPRDTKNKKKTARKSKRRLQTEPSETEGKRELCQAPAGHLLSVVVDRVVLRASDRGRLVEALETAFSRGSGVAEVRVVDGPELRFSRGRSCTRCLQTYRDPSPGLFSFNNPIGACEACRGFGRVIAIDWDKVIGDPNATLAGGAITAWTGKATQWERKELKRWAKSAGVPMDVAFNKLSDAHKTWLIEGDEVGHPDGWWGLQGWFNWMETRQHKMQVRVFLARHRKYVRCEDCGGARLKPDALQWRVLNRRISDFFELTVADAISFCETAETSFAADAATLLLVRECLNRLRALADVGLGYLTLDRQSRTLSGGETQRVALTSALGASLTESMFVLDEPTVGLHPSDIHRLRDVVRELSNGGNTVLMVEHQASMLQASDRVIELGPGAGENGGQVVFDGAPEQLAKADTLTGRSWRAKTTTKTAIREAQGVALNLEGASGNNLKHVSVEIPRGVLTCVTGVSGSGKSSLFLDTLVPAVRYQLGDARSDQLPYEKLTLSKGIRDVVHVDQTPLGRTSRGNPATYIGVWETLRKRLAASELGRSRDLSPGYFSANVSGGRCEACKGQGFETVEMQFLADVSFSCPSCRGTRFKDEALEVLHKGLNAAQILDLTTDEAAALFADDNKVQAQLAPLRQVGLGYLRLGQPLNTLSGGESQRLKLAEALIGANARSLIVLDEPTAGLHPSDIETLIAAFDALVEAGSTVIVIEHNMAVAAAADHIIDMGPGAGPDGGCIVASGSPTEVQKSKDSLTASFLRPGQTPATSPSVRPAAHVPSGISIQGAREHNLKNVSLEIPRGKLVAVTGPSGSGKSSLVFSVLFAEGQRRFLETLSPYARQYMPQLPRPDVERVSGIPPTIALEQAITRGGGNSTVATVTEIAHFVRLLFARIGNVHSDAESQFVVDPMTPAEVASDLRKSFKGRARFEIMAPVVQGRKGHYRELFEKALKEGITEAYIDGERSKLKPKMKLDRYKEHDIDLIVDRLKHDSGRTKVIAAIKVAAKRAQSEVTVRRANKARRYVVREDLAQQHSQNLDPRLFSFNTRQGACPRCEGRGELIVEEGRGKNRHEVSIECPDCEGTRLSDFARSVTVAGHDISHYLALSIDEARETFAALKFSGREQVIAKDILKELERRFAFLHEVGVGYLGLDRSAKTLSGGETQRVRLAAQLGSSLTGVLFVLDEPTIGLHPQDTWRLIQALRALVKSGNSVLVVEHDLDVIGAADWVIDVGPGGGVHGGTIVDSASPKKLSKNKASATGQALAMPSPQPRSMQKRDTEHWLRLEGAALHNLRGVDFEIPLGKLSVVTGVSGSGKSTLVRGVLLPAVRETLGLVTEPPGTFTALHGASALKRAVEVDQSPIGRTPRSTPATYVGIWNHMRALLAGTPEARRRGYTASRFSFNTDDGRCPACKGNGSIKAEMAFLPDVHLPCELCMGKRFTRETLEVQLHGLNTGQILDLAIEEAVDVFSSVPRVAKPLALLNDLGLGYLRLGQASNTLSGGEAQRLKLVSELGTGAAGTTLYVLDEPTTGLHRTDVMKLLSLLHRFVERGDTVLVIEHNTDLILESDWIVDLGPGGGRHGGKIVASGSPARFVSRKKNATADALQQALSL